MAVQNMESRKREPEHTRVRRVLTRLAKESSKAELFPDVAKEERAELQKMLRHVAVEGSLPSRGMSRLLEVFHRDVTFTPEAKIEDGRAAFIMEPVYRTPYAEVVHVLLLLSQDRHPTKVGVCKQCDELYVYEYRGRGRRREFCSAAHGDAYMNAKWRERNLYK